MRKTWRRVFYELKNDIRNTNSVIIINSILICLLGICISIWMVSNNCKKALEKDLELFVSVHSRVSDRGWTNNIDNYDDYIDIINQYNNLCVSLKEKYKCNYLSISKRLMNGAPIKMFGNRDNITVYTLGPIDYISKEELKNQFENFYWSELDSLRNFPDSNPSRLQSITEEDFIYKKKGVIKIEDGRTFTREEIENAANVCLINTNNLVLNKDGGKILEVGDKVLLSQLIVENGDFLRGKEYQFEIIGTYSMDAPMNINGSLFYPIFIPNTVFDTIYNDMTLFANQHDVEISMRNGVAIDDIVFEVDSFETMRGLIADLRKSDINLIINTECNGYESTLAIIESISKTFEYISFFMLSIVSLFSIISEVSSFKRKKFDILLKKSLGESNHELLIDQIVYTVFCLVISTASAIGVIVLLYNAILLFGSIGLITDKNYIQLKSTILLLLNGVFLIFLIKMIVYKIMIYRNCGE